MKQYKENIENLLKVLRAEQNRDGSFKSYSSFLINTFDNAEESKTIFTSSLILHSLSNSGLQYKEIGELKEECVSFLNSHKHTDGTWNYFTNKNIYVDDIDDTALAYLALDSLSKKYLKPKDFINFAHALIKCEIKEGGPYKTWLSSKYPKEVDLAVNANIARLLQKGDVFLPSLKNLIRKNIINKKYNSIYYISPLFTCYFLSFLNLPYELRINLKKYIISKNNGNLWENVLESALALNALINLSNNAKDIKTIKKYLNNLFKSITTNFKIDAICLDPAENGQQKYAGSKAITTALLLELTRFREILVTDEVNRLIEDIPLPKDITQKCFRPNFTLSTFYFFESLKPNIKQKIISSSKKEFLLEISATHMLGILAYDLFDDIYDESLHIEYLPTAINLIQNMRTKYISLGFDQNIIDYFIAETNEGMQNEKSMWKKDYLYPGRKSIGFALPIFLFISQVGIKTKSKEWNNLYNFFLHYLTARGLHDDLFDYKKDLKNNHPNSILDLIKKYPSHKIKGLANKHIKYHLKKAQEFLNKSLIINKKSYLQNLIEEI